MFGLNNRTVTYLLEQSDSVQYCTLYKTKYIPRKKLDNVKNRVYLLLKEILIFVLLKNWKINIDQCARTVSRDKAAKTSKHDHFSWLKSNERTAFSCLNRQMDETFCAARRALLSTDITNPMKFRHLKNFSKSALVVKRSPIHGRGLFALIDLYPGQMIIEYAGEIIRSLLCDKREKFYEAKVFFELVKIFLKTILMFFFVF